MKFNIPSLSFANQIFLLPRCPKVSFFPFLFFFLIPDILLEYILLLVNIEKYAFSIFLKCRKNFNYIFWYLLSSFASVFFLSNSYYLYIGSSLPVFSICQFHANPLISLCFVWFLKMPYFSYSIFLWHYLCLLTLLVLLL